MSEEKMIINTQGGPVITGGNFSNIEFVAQKFVLNEPSKQDANNQTSVDAEAELVDENKSPEPKKRNPKSLLFKSEQEQVHWSRVFLDFLKEHNRASDELTTSASAFVNRALACFHKEWEKRGLLNDNAYDKAPTLFLIEDCAIKGVGETTHSNKVKEILAKAYRYEQANPKSNMMTEVEEVVKNNL